MRALASQMRHHAGVIDFAAALSAEVARSPDHDLFDLLPTSRSSIGYRYDWTTYVIHPDASFTLEYKGRWRPYLLEFERRATTPKRARSRLKSYQRYFLSGWAERDHEGRLPRVLFVFESPGNENAFLDVADTVKGCPSSPRTQRPLPSGASWATHGFFRRRTPSTGGRYPPLGRCTQVATMTTRRSDHFL